MQRFSLQVAFFPFDIHPTSKQLIINSYLRVKSAIILPKSSFSNDAIHMILSSLEGRDHAKLDQMFCCHGEMHFLHSMRCVCFLPSQVCFIIIFLLSGIFRRTSRKNKMIICFDFGFVLILLWFCFLF